MKKCSYRQYPAKATVAVPRPGSVPLNLFQREKGPVNLQASLRRGNLLACGSWSRSSRVLGAGGVRLGGRLGDSRGIIRGGLGLTLAPRGRIGAGRRPP